MQVLVKMLLEEYVNNTLFVKKGIEIKIGKEFFSNRGSIVVPGGIFSELYVAGKKKFKEWDSIQNVRFYLEKVFSADEATIISQKGISYRATLNTLEEAEKIIRKEYGNENLTLDDVIEMYASDNQSIGSRMKFGVCAGVIISKQKALGLIYYDNELVYNGLVYVKRQTVEDEPLTGRIYIYGFENLGDSAEFSLKYLTEELKQKHSQIPLLFENEERKLVGCLKIFRHENSKSYQKDEFLLDFKDLEPMSLP